MVTISKLVAVKMCTTMTMQLKGPRSRVNMPIYMTCYLMVIVICNLPVTNFKIVAVEMCLTLAVTFRIGQREM